MNQYDSPLPEKLPTVLRLLSSARSKRITLTVLVGVLLLAGGVWYWYDSRSVVSSSVLAEADFTVYAPRQSPAGYAVEGEQTDITNGILTYKFTGESTEKDITVTVQDKPAGFDMNQLSKDGSVNTVSTPNGILYNLSIGGNTQYILDTGASLVYITSSSNIDNTTVVNLANSLKKYD